MVHMVSRCGSEVKSAWQCQQISRKGSSAQAIAQQRYALSCASSRAKYEVKWWLRSAVQTLAVCMGTLPFGGTSP